MQKTRIGISVGLFGAALYFVGLMSIIPLVIMAGFVLLFEENEWLKRTAVKAVAIVIFFQILFAIIGLVSNSSSILTTLWALFGGTLNLLWLSRILSILSSILSFVQTLLLLMLGFKALSQGNVGFGVVDSTLNKHMDQNSSACCPNCNKEATAGIEFCTGCGYKFI